MTTLTLLQRNFVNYQKNIRSNWTFLSASDHRCIFIALCTLKNIYFTVIVVCFRVAVISEWKTAQRWAVKRGETT